MLTIAGGNRHFASPGEETTIGYTNRQFHKYFWSPSTGNILLELDTFGQFVFPQIPIGNPNQPVRKIIEETTLDEYKEVPDGLGGFTISREIIKKGIFSYFIRPSYQPGDIIYIVYYIDTNTYPFTNTSSIQIIISRLFKTPTFSVDDGLSWLITNRNDTIPTAGFGQSGEFGWDLFWDENSGTWKTIETTGGGRYKETLVVVGQNSTGNGVVYYTV